MLHNIYNTLYYFLKESNMWLFSGSIYLNDCPKNPFIPIYLIVAGVLGIITNVSNLLWRCINCIRKNEDQGNLKDHANPLDGVLSVILFVWFIAGEYSY